MLVPALIFLVCFGGGVFGATRWLPDLAEGPVGGMAYFVVCGLLGAALAMLGLQIYLTIEALQHGGFGLHDDKGILLGDGLVSILFESGSLLGLAAIVYVLAPRPGAGGVRAVGAPALPDYGPR